MEGEPANQSADDEYGGEVAQEPWTVRFVCGLQNSIVAGLMGLGVAGPVLLGAGTKAALATYLVVSIAFYGMIRGYRRTGDPYTFGVTA